MANCSSTVPKYFRWRPPRVLFYAERELVNVMGESLAENFSRGNAKNYETRETLTTRNPGRA